MVRVNCDQCSQAFNTKKLFVSHLITKSCHKSIREAAKSQTRNKTTPEENFNYPTLEIVPIQDCAVCRRFGKAGLQMYMLAHLASHVQSKSEHFRCEDCDLKFESLFYLEKHENKKHKNEKCDQCPKKFRTALLLKKHVVDVHRKEKCNECDYNAASSKILDKDKHIYSKHPKDICDVCGMAFEDQSAVDKHFKEVHEKIKCDECDEEYEIEELLDNHKVEVHNHSKTTFKQFGGGLMMMMISENSEPTVEEMEVEENDDTESSRVNPLQELIPIQESNDKILEMDPSEDNMFKDEKEESKESNEDDIEQKSPNPNINVFVAGFFMMYAEDSENLADKEDSNLDSTDAEDPAVEDKEKLAGHEKDAEDPDVEETKTINEKEDPILDAEDSVVEETEKIGDNKDTQDPVMKENSPNDKNGDQEEVQIEKSILDESVIGEQQALEENERGNSSEEVGETVIGDNPNEVK